MTHQAAAGFGLKHFKRHQHLARQDEARDGVYRIEEGWACQYRLLSDGRRQIIALYLPGEYCEPQWILRERTTLPVVALTSVRARELSLSHLRDNPSKAPDGAGDVLSAVLNVLDSREAWIVSLGCMTATEKVCRLLREVLDRLASSGGVIHNSCFMPLTQDDVADIVGITSVHVNRVLKTLRCEGIIELRNRRLAVKDLMGLQRMCGPSAQRPHGKAQGGDLCRVQAG